MATRRRSSAMVFLAGHSINRLEFRRDISDKDVFRYRTGAVQGCAEHRNAGDGVRVQQRGCEVGLLEVGLLKERDLKGKLLCPYLMTEIICWTDEDRFLPSGSDAAVMWASGLGSTQTTPSTSTQAAPAPRV